MFKRLLSSLLFRVVLAIGIGTLLGTFVPESLNRIFATFNSLFVQFLGFAVPLIIMGLIMPAIADLGKGAGKLLLLTTAIAYGSTLFSGFSTYAIGSWAFPAMLQDEIGAMPPVEGEQLLPYFTISIPPILDVMSALVLAFIVGLGLAHQQASALANVVRDFRKIILQLIENVIVPLLPLFIMGIFAEMAFSGRVFGIMAIFLQIVGVIFLLHIALLVIQFLVAGAIAGRNPWRLLVTMLPAYFTALGTQSSAATIPVTLVQTEKNGVSPQVAGFVIPLCATIHLSGSMMKITACALALMLVEGMDTGLDVYLGFIPMLGVAMVAAPGVPGGAIMAAVGMLQLMLGFNEEMVGLMIALYIAMDSFGTACNVTGDGAIAVVVDKVSKRI